MNVYAQNLVINGDFEQYNNCPGTFGEMSSGPAYTYFPTVQDWINASSSCDYFNSCTFNPEASVPDNYAGFQEAHSGSAYCGFIGYRTNPWGPSPHRELIATRLAAALIKDSAYFVSFFVSPASLSAYPDRFAPVDVIALHEIGASFSDTLPYTNNYYPALDLPYHIVNDTNRRLADTNAWYEISGTYIAKGGEQWMTIGNFGIQRRPAYSLLVAHAGASESMSYLYLDDVSVTPTQRLGVSRSGGRQSNVSLYPNPSTGLITIRYSMGGIITVADAIGKVIQVVSLPEGKKEVGIKFNAPAPGIYYYRYANKDVITESGRLIIAR